MISDALLYFVASRWPSPMARDYGVTGEDALSDEYNLKYALHKQYLYKAKNGFSFDFYGKRILEIGCGHGGISVFLAVNGAKEVSGIDINSYHLSIAEKFKEFSATRLKLRDPLPVQFREMNATELDFADSSFDLVVADNIFEHIMNTEAMLQEVSRVLTKGGQLVIPAFNSIYSKHGLHLKHGLKMPWANLFFSEKTICNVMKRMAERNPKLYEFYPGLKDDPIKVRDLRAYKDLNGITYSKFRSLAYANGFSIKSFSIYPPGNTFTKSFLRFTHRLPILKNSLWADVTSVSATSILEKV